MAMGAAICGAAQIELLQPKADETVSQLWPDVKAFLALPREARELNADKISKSEKAAFLAHVGAKPVVFAWTGETNGVYTLKVARVPDGKIFVDQTVTGLTAEVKGRLEIARSWTWSVSDGQTTAKGSFKTEDFAPRIVSLDGVGNARDLGGRIGLDGRRVKQGLVLRTSGLNNNAKNTYYTYEEILELHRQGKLAGAGVGNGAAHLSRKYASQLGRGNGIDRNFLRLIKEPPKGPGTERLSAADRDYLLNFWKIKTDLDLRGDWETFGLLFSPLGKDVNFFHFETRAGYGGIVTPVGRACQALNLSVFVNRENYPIDFHCIGGTDRTGTLAYLLNAFLGVAEEELIRDYEMSFIGSGGVDKRHYGWLMSLVTAVRDLPGDTLADKVWKYYLSLGFTEDQLAQLREQLLEPLPGQVDAARKPKAELKDFPVSGDGAAIQAAIDQAAQTGGGRVVVAPGDHPCASLRLRSHVTLHLEKGARLVGSTKPEDYFSFPEDVCGVKPESSARVFVYAWDETDIAITGEGTVDGQGPAFFDHSSRQYGRFWAKPAFPRPRMVQFVRCRDVTLKNATFLDSPGWTMLIRLCQNIQVAGIRVVSNPMIINSDGIDFDGCRHVRVNNCDFSTGDDCLILRAMRDPNKPGDKVVCEDVRVDNCRLRSACQCIRIGCPSDDTIRNAKFRHLTFAGNNGIYFNNPANYLRPDDEGYLDVRDILFQDITGCEPLTGSAIQMDVGPGIKLRGVRNITYRNVNLACQRPLRFVGNVHTRFERVLFDNVTINGARQADGEVKGDYSEAGPLVRKSKSWETKRQ